MPVVYFRGNEMRTTQGTFPEQPKSLEPGVKTLRDGTVISSLFTDPEGRLFGTLYPEEDDRKLAPRKTAEPLRIRNYGAVLRVKKRKWI